MVACPVVAAVNETPTLESSGKNYSFMNKWKVLYHNKSVPKFISYHDEAWQIHSLPGKCTCSEEEELLVKRICAV